VTEARRIALAMARGGAAAVESSRGRLNDLNVYPVPDGDTGSNLAETARELAAGLADAPADTPADVATAAKRAVLMGASGNSGAILSQIVWTKYRCVRHALAWGTAFFTLTLVGIVTGVSL